MKKIEGLPGYFLRRIRGTNDNNIFICGDFNFIAHFNGVNWEIIYKFFGSGILYSISVKKDIVALAGIENGKAKIIIGKRN